MLEVHGPDVLTELLDERGHLIAAKLQARHLQPEQAVPGVRQPSPRTPLPASLRSSAPCHSPSPAASSLKALPQPPPRRPAPQPLVSQSQACLDATQRQGHRDARQRLPFLVPCPHPTELHAGSFSQDPRCLPSGCALSLAADAQASHCTEPPLAPEAEETSSLCNPESLDGSGHFQSPLCQQPARVLTPAGRVSCSILSGAPSV